MNTEGGRKRWKEGEMDRSSIPDRKEVVISRLFSQGEKCRPELQNHKPCPNEKLKGCRLPHQPRDGLSSVTPSCAWIGAHGIQHNGTVVKLSS